MLFYSIHPHAMQTSQCWYCKYGSTILLPGTWSHLWRRLVSCHQRHQRQRKNLGRKQRPNRRPRRKARLLPKRHPEKPLPRFSVIFFGSKHFNLDFLDLHILNQNILELNQLSFPWLELAVKEHGIGDPEFFMAFVWAANSHLKALMLKANH